MSSVSAADEEQSASCAPQVVEEKQQPTEDAQECETSGSDAEAATRTPCAFYMRTGTCAYVSDKRAAICRCSDDASIAMDMYRRCTSAAAFAGRLAACCPKSYMQT
jgi:hypothetical protein